MTDAPHTSVVRNDEATRYEIVVDKVATEDAVATRDAPTDRPTDAPASATAVAGFAAFHESETHIAFTHTEVDDAYQGLGLASRLAQAALADAVARDLTIIPLCPYIARYLERHPIEGARIEWPNRAPRP